MRKLPLDAHPVANCRACAIVAPLRMAADIPFNDATRADVERSENRGNAVAAKMPRITITSTSSIKVKPLCCFFMLVLLTKSVAQFSFEPVLTCSNDRAPTSPASVPLRRLCPGRSGHFRYGQYRQAVSRTWRAADRIDRLQRNFCSAPSTRAFDCVCRSTSFRLRESQRPDRSAPRGNSRGLQPTDPSGYFPQARPEPEGSV